MTSEYSFVAFFIAQNMLSKKGWSFQTPLILEAVKSKNIDNINKYLFLLMYLSVHTVV